MLANNAIDEDDGGILDEEICWECGVELKKSEYKHVIVCDICSGEFHIRCIKQARLPREPAQWTCPLCKTEREKFTSLLFNVSPQFEIPNKRHRKEADVVYNPSRPLDLAFSECVSKGLMMVKQLLPHNIMKILTHGDVERKTASGRVSHRWLGATKEITSRTREGSCSNIVLRDGRYDITLPQFVVDALGLDAILEPVLRKLRSIMGNPRPKVRTHNVVFVPVGSPSQEWHYDDSKKCRGRLHRYFTVLVNLNPIDENCGGTELRSRIGRGDYTHDLMRGRPGDAFVFNGSLEHRGHANEGRMHRFFYYASFACKPDDNADNS